MSEQIEDKRVLLKLGSGEYYALDEVGVRVWELCDGDRSVNDIVTVICEEYEAPASTVEADVVALLSELADEKLVVEAG